MPDGQASRRGMAAALTALLDGPRAPEDREAAWQDSLDLLALASGAKRVALIGCGYAASAWLAAVAELAIAEGFTVQRAGVPWLVGTEVAGLPGWYEEPVREAWATADLLTVCRPEEALRFGAGTPLISCDEEADLLSYPPCCVEDHHARRRIYHDLMVELISARCDTIDERRRLVAAEIMPALRDDADRRRLQEALYGEVLGFAGFVPCPRCVRDGSHGLAGLVDREMLELAHASGFPLVTDR